MSFDTTIEEEQGSFIWEIRNYSTYAQGKLISSPDYETDNARWSILLRKGGRFTKSVYKNRVMYTVLGERETEEPIRVKISFFVISDANVMTLMSESVFSGPGFRTSYKAVLSDEPLLNGYLEDDVLTLRFDVAFSEIKKCGATISESAIHKSSIETLHSDIRSYLSEQDCGDVLLRVEEQEFRVHKFILSSRSPVFRRMFENDMKEALTNTVSIPDVRAAVLKQMVSYMYGEEVDETSSDTCIGLYAAAEQYCLLDLKQRCARILEKNLRPDIACEVASMAHLHQDVQLLASASSYISSHAAEVIGTKGFVELLTEVPAIASDLAVTVTNTQL